MTESLWQQSKVNCPKNQTDCDPIPTWLLKVCASVLIPTITNIVNLSLTSGQFHHILKESVMSPLLKKPDKDQLSKYRPISNLSHISNIIERVAKCRLTDHLVSMVFSILVRLLILLLTLLRLNFSLSVSNSNFLK